MTQGSLAPPDDEWCSRLVAGGPDALLVVENAGRIAFANGRGEDMFGYPAGGLLGLSLRALLADASGESWERPLDVGDEAGQLGGNLDLYGRRLDGSTFPIEVNYSRLREDDQHIAASVRDVSHRQRTEAELRDALSLLSATLESTADGILVVTADGRIAGSNERFASMWGIPAELLASGDDERVMGFVLDQLADPAGFVDKVQELYHRPEAESNDVLEFRDHRVFERYSRPQRVGDQVVGRVWSFRDVTSRREAQEQARQARAELSSSDARFRALVESSDDAILSTSPDGTITSWNPAAERLFGYAQVEIVGRPLSVLIPGDVHRSGVADAQKLAFGTVRSSSEADFLRRDGTPLPVSLTVSPIYDGDRVTGISAIIRDITPARARQQELEEARSSAVEASRVKSEFLATMSHEIRTPMNGVIGLTGLLLRTELDEVQRSYAAGVRGAGEALLGIVNDILDFSKLEAGKVSLEQVGFSPRELVDEVGVLLAESAAAQGLELIIGCDPSIPEAVVGDPGRLRQTLINLAGNAVKFTPEGEIVISVALERDQPSEGHVGLRFEVRDTGIGIEAATLERLFEPFSQADASTTRRFGGTGLGLAISRRLVTAMGGDLVVTSTPGVGSVFGFSVWLPTDSAPVAEVDETLFGLRALVVDDNETNRRILVAQLQGWGMEPTAVPDADAAMTELRAAAGAGAPYDLAMLDLRMPGTDGLELAAAIDADEQLERTRCVILTSGGFPETLRSADPGVREWIRKPVRTSQLRAALERLAVPWVADRSTADSVRGLPESLSGGGRMGRLLVAEDNPVNQLVAVGVLGALGYTSVLVKDGAEALEALAAGSFDAVLMDCHMPRLDGYEATRALRKTEAGGRRTPVIAMTAGVLDEDRERCLQAGMDDFVPKPVSVEQLRVTLARWIPGSADDHATPVLTQSRLDELRALGPDDGWGVLPALVRAFVRNARQQQAELHAALGRDDRAERVRVAHSLRGAAANIGAEALTYACAVIETGDGSDDTALLSALDTQLDIVCRELRRLLAQPL